MSACVFVVLILSICCRTETVHVLKMLLVTENDTEFQFDSALNVKSLRVFANKRFLNAMAIQINFFFVPLLCVWNWALGENHLCAYREQQLQHSEQAHLWWSLPVIMHTAKHYMDSLFVRLFSIVNRTKKKITSKNSHSVSPLLVLRSFFFVYYDSDTIRTVTKTVDAFQRLFM